MGWSVGLVGVIMVIAGATGALFPAQMKAFWTTQVGRMNVKIAGVVAIVLAILLAFSLKYTGLGWLVAITSVVSLIKGLSSLLAPGKAKGFALKVLSLADGIFRLLYGIILIIWGALLVWAALGS